MDKRLTAMYREKKSEGFPDRLDITLHYEEEDLTLSYEKVRWNVDGEEAGLRYGENPHQQAALYRRTGEEVLIEGVAELVPVSGLSSDLELLQSGKHPGKINIVDVDRALQILRYLPGRPAAIIMKHNNPCGAARADTLAEAIRKAFEGDLVAAFGGAVVVNRPLDMEGARIAADNYFEIIAAPDFEPGVLELLSKKKNLRIFRIAGMDRLAELAGKRYLEFTSLVDGGLVLQNSYTTSIRSAGDFMPAENARIPTEAEARDLLFGWLVESGVSSNSVIYVKNEATVAIGTGEQDRVGVATIAREKAYRNMAERLARTEHERGFDLLDADAREKIMEQVRQAKGGLEGAVMISDGFFPFRDGVDVALNEGIKAIAEPGGSIRDGEVIEACNEHGAALVFTGERSFRH